MLSVCNVPCCGVGDGITSLDAHPVKCSPNPISSIQSPIPHFYPARERFPLEITIYTEVSQFLTLLFWKDTKLRTIYRKGLNVWTHHASLSLFFASEGGVR